MGEMEGMQVKGMQLWEKMELKRMQGKGWSQIEKKVGDIGLEDSILIDNEMT